MQSIYWTSFLQIFIFGVIADFDRSVGYIPIHREIQHQLSTSFKYLKKLYYVHLEE